MALRIFNTLSGEKEIFKPINPGKIGMYVCGVTVYDLCHIGHARANVVFDTIYRYLTYSGYDVTYIRNFTDIDDKIINRANRESVDYKIISERYIEEFNKDMGALSLLKPTVEPKATENIDGIISIIEKLIEKGHAYESEGDVYYAVDTFPEYLKLSGRNMEDMLAGARVEIGEKKRNHMDFALWKNSKPNEPWWESPWGKGRPGWHIECSAMSMKYLGKSFDIHGGGKDLVFPHHENEIAQSEGANGCKFVNYWIHNGFVNINNEKMSKSLGNFFTIRDVLKEYNSEALRFFILSAHYRSPIDFCDQNLNDATSALTRIYSCIAELDKLLATTSDSPDLPPFEALSQSAQDLSDKVESFSEKFRDAMDDDFNTAQAIGLIFDIVRSANRFINEIEKMTPVETALIAKTRHIFAEASKVLGLFSSDAEGWLDSILQAKSSRLSISPEEIEKLIEERTAARKAKNFARGDEIRDFLNNNGILLLDSAAGTTWQVK